MSNSAGLRLRNKCSTCSPDTIVFEQFMWSTVEEYSVLIPIRSLGILFGSRLLRCGCPGSTRRSYIYKLPINRPSGRILSGGKKHPFRQIPPSPRVLLGFVCGRKKSQAKTSIRHKKRGLSAKTYNEKHRSFVWSPCYRNPRK